MLPTRTGCVNPMSPAEPSADLEQFLRARIDPACFTHREHVRMGFEALRRYEFLDATVRYSRALRRLCERAGRPEKFHQTVTLAFLALIAERLAAEVPADFSAFAAANPDLLDPAVLTRWYSPHRLASAAARRVFLLPNPAG